MLACFLRSKWTGSGKVALMITGVFFLEKVRGHENKTSGEKSFRRYGFSPCFHQPFDGPKVEKKTRGWVIEAVHEY